MTSCGPADGANAVPGSDASGAWTRARVVRVIDGDTIEVQYLSGARLPSTRVRLIGIDTPEVHGVVEAYGERAAAYTRRELLGRTVWLEKDVGETDRYGRSLRYVWLDRPPGVISEGVMRSSLFNARLLLDGYARLATYPPDVKYVEFFRRFEREARERERGLWGAEGE